MSSTLAKILWTEAVADLDELSIDNLKCGRITKEVMRYAIGQVTQKGKYPLVDWRLADLINDLLEVGREESDVDNPTKIAMELQLEQVQYYRCEVERLQGLVDAGERISKEIHDEHKSEVDRLRTAATVVVDTWQANSVFLDSAIEALKDHIGIQGD